MRKSDTKRNLIAIAVMALLLTIAAPATSFAQGRHGRWDRDRNNNYWSRDRKCRKFVNCHDARDGRWDGRGPRGDRVGYSVWQNRYRVRNRNQNLWWQRREWQRRHRN
jgi:hypothetical protein